MTGSLFTDPPGGGSGGAGHRGAKHNVFFKVTNTFYETNIEKREYICLVNCSIYWKETTNKLLNVH